MSREEAAVLSSAQRHEVRRQAEEAAVYRANPLLYLTSPAVQVSSDLHVLTFGGVIFMSLGYSLSISSEAATLHHVKGKLLLHLSEGTDLCTMLLSF